MEFELILESTRKGRGGPVYHIAIDCSASGGVCGDPKSGPTERAVHGIPDFRASCLLRHYS